MAASVQFRPQSRDLGMVMREVDEDLAIFLGIRNAEKQRDRDDHFFVDDSLEFDGSKGLEQKPDSLSASDELQADDNFLNLEIDKNDYNWLLTQPDTSLLPSVEVEAAQDSLTNQIENSNGEDDSPKSEAKISSEESASLIDNTALQQITSTGAASSATAKKKPLSSRERKPTSRAATPTGRPSLPTKSKPSRPSTPTSRATLPSSSKSMDAQPKRSSTPSKSSSRSSTPAGRPSVPINPKPAPTRSATPTRKPAVSVPAPDRSSSSSGKKSPKNPPAVKSRPLKPSEMLSVSHDAPQSLKTLMPKRPASASRGRPSPPASTQLSSSSSNGKPRQKSCSPARVRAPFTKTGNVILSRSRGHGNNGGDEVNPVLMGTQMVERVVNMRKLAPPKQDECLSLDNPKKSSQERSGFGRSLSKKSLDMAIRHMDIRRSISDNLRPVATGAKTGSAKSCPIGGASESPLASSSVSSDSSISSDYHFVSGSVMDN